MLANLLIGLREGLEAALIVSILLAYLTRIDRRESHLAVWLGTVGAVVTAIACSAALDITNTVLEDAAQEIFAGITSLVAVVLVTWMVLWMASRARTLRVDLEARAGRASATGPFAMATIAFVAVIREGLETAIFIWSTTTATGDAGRAVAGAVLGLGLAVVLGAILYRGAIHVNLAVLMRWSGAGLVLVAGGVLSYAVGEFLELGWIPGEHAIAFDIRNVLPEDGVIATVLRGLLNFRPLMPWPVLIAWALYVVPVLSWFLRKTRRPLGVRG